MVLLRPKAFEISLWDFPTVFSAVILPFSNSDNLVLLTIYDFSIISIIDLIAFILRRRYIKHFSIKLSPFFVSFYWWSYIYVKNKFYYIWRMNWNFFLFQSQMSLNLIFHISNFHNSKIVNNIFFFVFEGVLIFLSRGIYIYIYIYIFTLCTRIDCC